MAGARTLNSEPRSTAYYYGDLEKIKRNQESLNNEILAPSDVINEAPIREIPPFRDRKWSLPEYSTPENSRKIDFEEVSRSNGGKGETYSTAGTFPMPETKEKEPLLAELEVVGRLPLSQLEPGVRRSRSWYLCCPNMGEEEISRESSWRYSSLRTVTSAPAPGQNGVLPPPHASLAHADDAAALRAERDALARALATERQRRAAAARAHDARLAELHGVIAELVRRRGGAIPEEELTDECESTTQPAGELDNDADRSRTEQNDSSSLVSGEDATPDEKVDPRPADEVERRDLHISGEGNLCEYADNCDTSLNLSDKLTDTYRTHRCEGVSGGSCDREHGSDERVYTVSTGRCESRKAKLASRVKLKRTEDNTNTHEQDTWCAAAAEQLAMDVCAHADLREAMITAHANESCVCAVRSARLQAQCAVLRGALARAADTAHRLYVSCSVQEQACVGACLALSAADRALEAYDVLLALAETAHTDRPTQRAAAEAVCSQLVSRLESETAGGALLSAGPWTAHGGAGAEPWSPALEARLREHAARLKASTVALRPTTEPKLFTYHDVEEDEIPECSGKFNMADMEAAVLMEELLLKKENKLLREMQTKPAEQHHIQVHKSESTKSRRRRERHWLETQASETDL